MRADGAKAKPFRDWVVREVLPSSRKTGSYDLKEHGRDEMPLPPEILGVFKVLTAAVEKQTEMIERLLTRTGLTVDQLEPEMKDYMTAREVVVGWMVKGGMPNPADLQKLVVRTRQQLSQHCRAANLPWKTAHRAGYDIRLHPREAVQAVLAD